MLSLGQKAPIMKNLVLFVFVLFVVNLSAQDPLIFEEVVEVDSADSKELYSRAESWALSNFKDAAEVIQIRDKEGGKLAGKFIIRYEQKNALWMGSENTRGPISCEWTLLFKDGRYKYTFGDFYHKADNDVRTFGTITTAEEFTGGKMPMTTKKWRKRIWDDIKNNINETVPPLIESLKSAMSKKSDDNW